jgi:hypothetical protein
MEDLDLELNSIEGDVEGKLKVKNRFEKLSEKVILTSKEKEAEAEARKKAEAERDSVSKERDFYKDFSVNVSKYPQAAEYQDKILEKVRNGYSTKDAMVTVLNDEGKFMPIPPEQRPAPQVEGGSAPTSFEGNSEPKTLEEKRNFLLEADRRGDLAAALRGR